MKRWYFVCPHCEAKWFHTLSVGVCPRCGRRAESQDIQTPPWDRERQSTLYWIEDELRDIRNLLSLLTIVVLDNHPGKKG